VTAIRQAVRNHSAGRHRVVGAIPVFSASAASLPRDKCGRHQCLTERLWLGRRRQHDHPVAGRRCHRAVRRRRDTWFPSPGVPAGSFVLLMVEPAAASSVLIAPAWPAGPGNGMLVRGGVRCCWPPPLLAFVRFYFESVEMLTRRSSRHRRNLAQFRCRLSKPSTMPDYRRLTAVPHRGLPFRVIVLCLGQLGDVERGVAECDQLAPGRAARCSKNR
jgi:hypothetical protein